MTGVNRLASRHTSQQRLAMPPGQRLYPLLSVTSPFHPQPSLFPNLTTRGNGTATPNAKHMVSSTSLSMDRTLRLSLSSIA